MIFLLDEQCLNLPHLALFAHAKEHACGADFFSEIKGLPLQCFVGER